jgi:hypothetical protein
VTHPLLRRPDGQASRVESYETPLDGGPHYTGFEFDQPWELIPGLWTFALLRDGHVLAEQSFTIAVAPAAAGVPPGGCAALVS